MYNLLVVAGALLYIFMFSCSCRKTGTSWKKGILLSIISLVIQIAISKGLDCINTGRFGTSIGYYIRMWVFMPAVYYCLSKLFKMEYLKLLDMQAIPNLTGNSLGKFACVLQGCCGGFEYYEGTAMHRISHALTGTGIFPVQLAEIVVGFSIALGLWLYSRRKKEYTSGILFCAWYILFGLTRFLLEFLRDNKKIIILAPLKQANGSLGISELAIWALLMAAAGVVIYDNIRKMQKEK